MNMITASVKLLTQEKLETILELAHKENYKPCREHAANLAAECTSETIEDMARLLLSSLAARPIGYITPNDQIRLKEGRFAAIGPDYMEGEIPLWDAAPLGLAIEELDLLFMFRCLPASDKKNMTNLFKLRLNDIHTMSNSVVEWANSEEGKAVLGKLMEPKTNAPD